MNDLHCKQTGRVPPVVADGQRVQCPDCKHYHDGHCGNPGRETYDGPCPFDRRELPLRDVTEPAGGGLVVHDLRRLNDPPTRWLNLYELDYTHAGHRGKWVFAARSEPKLEPSVDAVIVVATVATPDGPRLVCTSEFRPIIGAREYGFVAGLINPGEAPAAAAARELWEETGLTVDEVVRVGPPMVSSAGLSTEAVQMVFVRASGTLSGENREAGEKSIEVMLLDHAEVCDLANVRGRFAGAVVAGKSWPVLFMFEILGHL